MGRSPCCSKDAGLNRGAWTAEEDLILSEYIAIHGDGEWKSLPQKAGLKRCGKSCRLRWLNYLRPDIKRGNISPDEEELIIRMHKLLGNRWSLIAGRLPGRTDNEIKNYWNTRLWRKIQCKETRSAYQDEEFSRKPKSSEYDNHVIKIVPVRTSVSRINKIHKRDHNIKLQNSTFTEHSKAVQSSWSELWVDELMTESDMELVDIKLDQKSDILHHHEFVRADEIMKESDMELVDINLDQKSDILHHHEFPNFAENEVNTHNTSSNLSEISPDSCNLFSSLNDFKDNLSIEGTESRQCKDIGQIHSVESGYNGKIETFGSSREQEMEDILNYSDQIDWVKELLDLN